MALKTSLIDVSKIHYHFDKYSNYDFLLGMHDTALKMFYEEANQRLEKLNGILIFVLTKVMLFIASIPTFIVSFFNYYFTTELDGEAFQFVLPLW